MYTHNFYTQTRVSCIFSSAFLFYKRNYRFCSSNTTSLMYSCMPPHHSECDYRNTAEYDMYMCTIHRSTHIQWKEFQLDSDTRNMPEHCSSSKQPHTCSVYSTPPENTINTHSVWVSEGVYYWLIIVWIYLRSNNNVYMYTCIYTRTDEGCELSLL